MARKKKKHHPVAVLVGGAVGSSLIASAMPGTTGAPLQAVGTGLSGFVGPAVAVTGAGMVISSLKKFPKPPKRKRRRR